MGCVGTGGEGGGPARLGGGVRRIGRNESWASCDGSGDGEREDFEDSWWCRLPGKREEYP